MGKKIVIIGAGYSGVLTAKKLAKKFKNDSDVTITVINKEPFHTMLTELHEVAANRVEEDSIKLSLKKIFAGRKVDVKLDTAVSVDFEKQTVLCQKGTYDYDYLVLSAGSKPTFFGTEGAEEFSFKLWSYENAVRLKDHIHDMFRKAAKETDPEERKKLLTFYIVGAGFTGVEMAGELAEYTPFLCKNYEIDRNEVTICDMDFLGRACPNLPEKLSEKIERRMRKMGVRVAMNTSVVKVGKDFVETKSGDVITREGTYTVIWTAGIEGSDIASDAGKTLAPGGRGRLTVDAYLRASGHENIYAVGDTMFYIPEGEERPVPQIVENCELSADTAAHNIAAAIAGSGQMKPYKPQFHGFMISIGGRYAVASVGLPNHKLNLPSWFAMFSKHMINIIYFIQVLGWNKVFSYMKHEFFTIRNCRSFVGGHFSNRTPSFLLLPLRVWLGMVWLYEGVAKIAEGWLTTPKLTGFFGGAQSWYNNILGIDGSDATSHATGEAVETAAKAVKAAADAVSSATGAGGGAAAEGAGNAAAHVGTVLFNLDFFGLFHAFLVSGKALAESTLTDIAFKLDVPFINWFMREFVLSNDGMQVAMQVFIVIAEIAVGLALIGGLFTFLASGFSLVMQVMFVTTTGLYLNTFWMIAAAIAVLIGGGSTFGLDYYVIPALKNWWKRLPGVRKSYLYHD